MINLITNDIKRISCDIKEKIISIRRELHRNPELGFNEYKTSQLISNHLQRLGLEVKTNMATTGLCALLKTQKPGRTVAIRADMDALPTNELNICDYSSSNQGVMHACGHDAHMAIVLGTAEVLSRVKSQLCGNIKFIFQPGEEGLGGAKYMISDGVLESPKVDAILALHVWPDLETGQISVCPGAAMATPSEFEIIIKGKSGHAAQPHNFIDPISIGVNLINLFQTIITREKNPLEQAILSVTCFNAGSSFNIIPDRAVIKGTVRTFDPNVDKKISGRMEEMTSSVAKALGAGHEFIYNVGYPPVINDEKLSALVLESAAKILTRKDSMVNLGPSMAAEDFSYYAQKVPGLIFGLGCTKPGSETVTGLHNSRFDIDEDCLQTGMELLSQSAVDFLKNE